MIGEFDIVGLGRPKYLACWTEKRETFFPKVEMSEEIFKELFNYCKGDWTDPKIAVIEYESLNGEGKPLNSVLKEIKLKNGL